MEYRRRENILKPQAFAEKSLRKRLRTYESRIIDVESYLLRHPDEWGRYQFEFNENVDYVFNGIIDSVNCRGSANVSRLKSFFIEHYRHVFLRGQLNAWSLNKPYGYAGDFWIIDQIYRNKPETTGFERLFDNYFQMSAISVAVRNRKDDFRSLILQYVSENKNKKIRIMDLASGPGRELKELADDPALQGVDIEIDCYDHDVRSLEYARNLLKDSSLKVNYICENALRICAAKDILRVLKCKYDFIFSTGLFDYLNKDISVKLLRNLYLALNTGGVLAVSDVRDKHKNPSVYYMEWVGEWELSYNDDDEFRSHCHLAGLDKTEISYQYEQQGILQYVIAKR
jgi:2-polyprenyl-3-methyl-5-hydroxy-6-metoxy-1,4-benzoquinol methylase